MAPPKKTKAPPPAPMTVAWPADQIERRKIGKIRAFKNNPRTHSESQVHQIAASMLQFGWTIPVLVDETDGLIAGHGRLLAAALLVKGTLPIGKDDRGNIIQADPMPEYGDVPCLVARGWSEAQKRAYVIADNQLTLLGGWDNELLKLEFEGLAALGFDTSITGFSLADIAALNALDDGTRTEEEEALDEITGKSDGSLLALVDIAISEPRHKVEHGEIWKVGPHLLFCNSVMTEWSAWASSLDDENVIFAPYPGPFVPLGEKADEHKLIMVQPDRYIAGHLLDRYEDIKGKGLVKKVNP